MTGDGHDAVALFELASDHDRAGREAEAVDPLAAEPSTDAAADPAAVELRPVSDESVLVEVVAAAAGAAPDDVTPPLGDGWSEARIDWLRAYHRARFDGLAGTCAELTLAVIDGGRIRGVARLRALGEGRHETGVWLVRDVRGRGVGRAVLTDVLDVARSVGAREVVAATTPDNAAAQALLRGAGFVLDVGPERVSATRSVSRP